MRHSEARHRAAKGRTVWIAIVLLAPGVCGIICAAIGMTLLADAQAWVSDTLV